MGIVEAMILGLVQGLTEFLPISSTAHIRLVPVLFGWGDPGAPFTAAIQMGTLVAVIAYFRADLGNAFAGWAGSFTRKNVRGTPEARLGWAVAWGTLPIVALGVLFRNAIETGLRSLYVIAWALISVGVLMGIAEWIGRKTRKTEGVVPADGVAVGLFQALALIPGVSRSGSSITGALFLGFERAEAARFSFLLSIPSVFAAAVYSLWKHRDVLLGPERTAVWVANGVSLVSGYVAIAFLLNMLRKHGMIAFVLYRVALGTFLLVALSRGLVSPL